MKVRQSSHFLVLGFATLGLFSAFLGQAIFMPVGNTSAVKYDDDTPVATNVAAMISLTVAGADETGKLPIEVDLTSGTYMGTGAVTVGVSTNDINGYSLFINTDKTDTSLTQNGVTDRIRALTGETTVANFPENYWGYSIDGGNVYYPVLPSTENPGENSSKMATAKSAKTYNQPVVNDETEVTIGAKVSSRTADGTYGNTVVFTAISNTSIANATSTGN